MQRPNVSAVTSARLAKNTAIIALGQVIPAIAGLLAVPLLLGHLGAARFGVLLLAWGAIGYFSLFDLGLSRALTHAVAVRLGKRDHDDLPTVVWTALGFMLVLGLAGGALLAAITPWIVGYALNIDSSLQAESRVAFYLLALSLPAVVSTAGFRGLLEAHQDFGIATALRVPLALFTFLGPLLVLPFSGGLPAIVGVLVFGRSVLWVAHVVACVRRYEYLRLGVRFRSTVVGPLLRYGGWMTVSNVVSPLMAQLDRFLIASILPMAAVAYYAAPAEVITRLLIFPQALVAALFPAIAYTYQSDSPRATVLFGRALRVVLLAMFPLLAGVVLFAREGLTLWLGSEFASHATGVTQWLAIGIFLNSLAQVPFAMLQGTGRPDLTGKLHLAELPVYAAAIWWLAHRFGLEGVAMAWTGRVALDMTGLLWLARRAGATPGSATTAPVLLCMAMIVTMGLLALIHSLPMKIMAFGALVTVTALGGWTVILAPHERGALRAWARPTERSTV